MPSEGRVDDDSRFFHLTGPVTSRDWPEVPHTYYFGTGGDKAREALEAVGLTKVDRSLFDWTTGDEVEFNIENFHSTARSKIDMAEFS